MTLRSFAEDLELARVPYEVRLAALLRRKFGLVDYQPERTDDQTHPEGSVTTSDDGGCW